MSEPIFSTDGEPAEESVALLTNAYINVLHEIRCDPFYWCGTPILADRHYALIEAFRRVFGIECHSNSDHRFSTLCDAAMKRGWSIYVEQVRPNVDERAIAELFDESVNPKPEAVEKLSEMFTQCADQISPALTRGVNAISLMEEVMAEALEQSFGIKTPGGPPRHISDMRLRRLADMVLAKHGFPKF
jgi:hypothetical protein